MYILVRLYFGKCVVLLCVNYISVFYSKVQCIPVFCRYAQMLCCCAVSLPFESMLMSVWMFQMNYWFGIALRNCKPLVRPNCDTYKCVLCCLSYTHTHINTFLYMQVCSFSPICTATHCICFLHYISLVLRVYLYNMYIIIQQQTVVNIT